MAVPELARKVAKPVNTIVEDSGGILSIDMPSGKGAR